MSAMNRLTLKYAYDRSFFDPKLTRDDLGYLSISARTDRFSERGGFWVQWQDLREFSEALATFLIATDAPIAAQWGYEMQEGDDLILRIEIAAANKRGDLVASFVIADLHSRSSRVSDSFQTNYPDVEGFRLSIARMMDREVEEAVLEGR